MNNIIKLVKDGQVKTKEREFTRVLGGFNENNPVITDLQVAELLGYKLGARQVRQTLERNKEHFEENVHYINIKPTVAECNTRNILKELNYSEQSINLSKNIYMFSESGFLLFLKFAEGEQAVNIYKDFIEDYFKTKAENIDLKLTLQEEIEKKYELHDSLFGKAIRTRDRDLLMECDKLNEDIIELEKKLTEELTIEKYQKHISGYENLMDSDGSFTFENCSKIISTNATGENLNIKVNKISLPKILREKGILSKAKSGTSYNNTPNSGYEEYFTVSAYTYTDKSGVNRNKTNVKVNPKGLDYIYIIY